MTYGVKAICIYKVDLVGFHYLRAFDNLPIQVGGGKEPNNERYHGNCISLIDVVKEVRNASVRQTSAVIHIPRLHCLSIQSLPQGSTKELSALDLSSPEQGK